MKTNRLLTLITICAAISFAGIGQASASTKSKGRASKRTSQSAAVQPTLANKPFDPTKPVRRAIAVRQSLTTNLTVLETVGGKTKRLKPTVYYVPKQGIALPGFRTALLDRRGHAIATVSRSDKRKAEMEGCFELKNGKIASIETYVKVGKGKKGHYESRWMLTDHPRGAYNPHLVAFRSIAVDPRVIPPGSKVLIRRFIGLRLPDKTVHDGILYADDAGKLIRNDHIDVFVGPEANRYFLERNGIGNMKVLEARILPRPTNYRVATR